MKKLKLIAILLLICLFFPTFNFAQQSEYAALTKSDSLIKIIMPTDSLSLPKADSLKNYLLNRESLKLKLILKNDHRWNNWAIDTTLRVFSLPLKINRKPYKMAFDYIPLQSTNPDKKEKIKRYLKPGLAAITLGCNWGSFYLKRVADDYYAKYRHTSDLDKINYYYNKTRQFDQFSNVLLGVSVVSLSIYLYLLLSD